MLLAGCYRPAAEDACKVLCPTGECPEGAQCMAGQCVPNGGTCPGIVPTDDGMPADMFVPADAFVSPDATPDAPGTTTCMPLIMNLEGQYKTGQSFTMNRAKTRAALLTFDSTAQVWTVSVGEGPSIDSSPPAFIERIAPSGFIAEIGYPRMSPDGTTIFMTAKDSSEQSFGAFSTRNAVSGQWSAAAALFLQDMNGIMKLATFGLVLGTPSEASPRRMPISYDTTNLREFEEVAQNTWRERTITTANSLGVILVREPNFTPDGLRVVFIGQKAGGSVAIFSATRTMIGQPWSMATQIFDDAISAEASAFLAADCSVLFYDNSNAGVVNRAR